jgi:hypothetical protein
VSVRPPKRSMDAKTSMHAAIPGVNGVILFLLDFASILLSRMILNGAVHACFSHLGFMTDHSSGATMVLILASSSVPSSLGFFLTHPPAQVTDRPWRTSRLAIGSLQNPSSDTSLPVTYRSISYTVLLRVCSHRRPLDRFSGSVCQFSVSSAELTGCPQKYTG